MAGLIEGTRRELDNREAEIRAAKATPFFRRRAQGIEVPLLLDFLERLHIAVVNRPDRLV